MINTRRGKIPAGEVAACASERPQDFFDDCNRRYEDKLGAIADRIRENLEQTHIIMLSGPSASGKTTTSLKLRDALAERGITATAVSMDDFFKNRSEVPLQADGSGDFESIAALDLELLKDCLAGMIYRGRADLPIFQFKTGRRLGQTRAVTLGPGSVAIVEGLHALDSTVTEDFPRENIFKLYVSVSSDFADGEDDVLLSARDVRLIRRTIRDYNFRASSPMHTLNMWDDVCRGEDLYVRPFKKEADIAFNSLFRCEPCLFKDAALKLFGSVPPGNAHYRTARRLMHALGQFPSMPMELAPADCMLREFTGGSVYYNRSAGKKAGPSAG
jgi:uridine kinase